MPNVILHNNIMYEEFTNQHCVGYKKLSAVDTKNKPFFSWGGGKFDLSEWDKVLAFLIWTQNEFKSESLMNFYHDEANNKLFAIPVPQFVGTGMTVTADANNEEMWAKHYLLTGGCEPVGTVHHHCLASAFQSGTDKQDETNKFGLHITIGNIGQEQMSFHSRVSFFQEFFEPQLGEWFDLMNPVLKRYERKPFYNDMVVETITRYNNSEFPEEWKEFCQIKKYTTYLPTGHPYGTTPNYGQRGTNNPDCNRFYHTHMKLHKGGYARRDGASGVNEYLNMETGEWIRDKHPSTFIPSSDGVYVAESYILNTVIPEIKAKPPKKNMGGNANTSLSLEGEGSLEERICMLLDSNVIISAAELNKKAKAIAATQITTIEWMKQEAAPFVEALSKVSSIYRVEEQDELGYDYSRIDFTSNITYMFVRYMELCCERLVADLAAFIPKVDWYGMSYAHSSNIEEILYELALLSKEVNDAIELRREIVPDEAISVTSNDFTSSSLIGCGCRLIGIFNNALSIIFDTDKMLSANIQYYLAESGENEDCNYICSYEDAYLQSVLLVLGTINSRWNYTTGIVEDLLAVSGITKPDIQSYLKENRMMDNGVSNSYMPLYIGLLETISCKSASGISTEISLIDKQTTIKDIVTILNKKYFSEQSLEEENQDVDGNTHG